MQIAAYVFIIIWLGSSLMGVMKPKCYMERFSSLSKTLGVNPEQLTEYNLMWCRIINGFLTTFCLFILYNLLLGRVVF